MPEILDKASDKTGLPPGSLVHIGEHAPGSSRISTFIYDPEQCTQYRELTAEKSAALVRPGQVSWINVSGVHDRELIARLGALFGLHHLLMEDIMHTGQRPKVEEYEQVVFIVLKMLTYDSKYTSVQEEQVSLVLGDGWVLSFQEREGDMFDSVRDRILRSKGKIRKMGSDYLVYTLVDAVVDHYFGVLEQIGDKIEDLQDKVLESPNPEILTTIHEAKQELIFVRHVIWPLREALHLVVRGELDQVSDHVEVYFRDVLDHTLQVLDAVETFRDMLAGTMDIYLSSLSHHMNQVMKVLTVIATLFIPLTFIVGVYGMNFEHMPELSWRYGYLAVWAVMIVLGGSMILALKRRGWF